MTESNRPSILVLFPDDWASFSPSLTRLVDLLTPHFQIDVLVLDTGRFDLDALDPAIYRRISIPPLVAGVMRKTGTLRPVRVIALAMCARRASRRATRLIAVDSDGSLAACLLGRRFHFLSLEISRYSISRLVVPWRALSVTIQSRERLQYQFAPASIAHLPVFLVQNAPSVSSVPIRESDTIGRDLSRPRLVYMGNAIPTHGLVRMLDLIRAWPEASLTIQGAVPESSLKLIQRDYPELLTQERLQISKRYLREHEISQFLSDFDIGMCLYELQGRARHNFNYVSAPAGKMFNYFAAGMPVIGSNLIGLNPVSLHHAGVLATTNSVDSLRQAAAVICADYPHYCDGARRAALAYDFNKAAGELLALLRSRLPQ